MSFVFPAAIKPGDVVAVVAPSSPFDPEEFERGVAWLRERYDVRWDARILTRAHYLAGDDARRAEELSRAMSDPAVRAIVAARGGYGAMRILDRLPWDAWAARPSWLVGFSDITALHVMASARGVASIHAPHVTALGRATEAGESRGKGDTEGERVAAFERLRARWRACLEAPKEACMWGNLRVVHAGKASNVVGPLVGGNLALLEAMAAAGRLVFPPGAILALEDVSERPYRVDRMLTALRLGGYLARLGGIVFGDFFKCEPGPDGAEIESILVACTRDLNLTVLAGAPFGHAERNDAFVLGATARIEGGTLRLG